MAVKALIDTNVLIDYLAGREPFFNDAKEVIALCADRKLSGYAAAHSYTNAFYVLRKYFTPEERREMLTCMMKIVPVVSIWQSIMEAAIQNDGFSDMEDSLQYECARAVGAELIITRNEKDFINSDIPVMTPARFLARLKEEIHKGET